MKTISIRKKCLAVFLCTFLTVSIAACQKPSEEEETLKDRDKEISQELEFDHSMKLSYAEQFAVDYYKDGYVLITISNGDRYLVIPEGKRHPKNWTRGLSCCISRLTISILRPRRLWICLYQSTP